MDDATVRAAIERVTDTIGGRRRLLAAGCAAVAVVAGLHAARPAAARTRTVWVAARDLSGGAPLAPADVRRVALPVPDVPSGALGAGSPVAGRLLAAPVRRGEALTDVRLLGPSLLAALPDPSLVAVPVHIADGSAAAALVRAGDVVDVLAVAGAASPAAADLSTVASRVRVLSVPRSTDASGDGGGLVVVAATRAQAGALARAAATTRLSLALDRP